MNRSQPDPSPRPLFASLGSSIGLDLKLGVRMLGKHPMLTIVGGVAIAVTSAIGVGASEFVRDLMVPTLPLDDGHRIVRLYQIDSAAGERRAASLYDLGRWRESVSSLEGLGAYATLEQGLVSDRGEVGAVNLARISASIFRVARVAPLMGRVLLEEDEALDAPPVVVLGERVWRDLLGDDPDPVGRKVELAGAEHTVVGIMPEAFGIPEIQDAWVPLRMETAGLEPETAPRMGTFARLAPGATLEAARAELAIAGRRAAADHPDFYGRLEPGVQEFARRGSDLQVGLLLSGVRLLLVFLLLVACANVATLVFARTVRREGEIAVRLALGASRRRIVLQLFLETLVLVGAATLVGMGIAAAALGRIARLFFEIQQEPRLPFWWNDALSPSTVLYAGALALAGALMIGVVPALKATAGGLRPWLGEQALGGDGGPRFGGIWTVVIVLQVALSVAFLPLAVSQADTTFDRAARAAFPAEQYLTAQLGRDADVPPRTPAARAEFLESSRQLFDQVLARLAAEPTVRGVALAAGLSAMNHLGAPVEMVTDDAESSLSGGARVLLVDERYLDLMNATPVAGRRLGPADFHADSRTVVVNQSFIDRVLGGRNPVGARLRFPERTGESAGVRVPEVGATVEVVGVVRDPDIDAFGPGVHPAIYAPLDLAPLDPRAVGLVGMPQAPAAQLFVRSAGDAGALTALLYSTVAAVDPSLRLTEVGTAAAAWQPSHVGTRLGAAIFLAVAAIVLMLSVAGIYALMSFTVSRRTREIAIRCALGARRRQVLRTVFGRAVVQLSIGVALGSVVAVPALSSGVAAHGFRSLAIVAVVLFAAGLAACLVPVRRALAIEPAAAMKVD